MKNQTLSNEPQILFICRLKTNIDDLILSTFSQIAMIHAKYCTNFPLLKVTFSLGNEFSKLTIEHDFLDETYFFSSESFEFHHYKITVSDLQQINVILKTSVSSSNNNLNPIPPNITKIFLKFFIELTSTTQL